jgi:hypothetical protein
VQRFSLAENVHIHPTPGGGYYAVSSPESDPSRRLLQRLLLEERTPELTLEGLHAWCGIENEEESLALLHLVQQLNWVQGLDRPVHCPDQPLETLLPDLLSSLGASGKVLLADSQGFYLASSGFAHEVAEELSALSADLASLHERRSGLLMNNLGLGSSAWAVVDAVGNSKIGFWPLYIGKQRFVLVISGIPRLNQPKFVDLIWTLSMRYAISSI